MVKGSCSKGLRLTTAILTSSDSKLARLFLMPSSASKLWTIIVPGNSDSGVGRLRATGMIRALDPVSR